MGRKELTNQILFLMVSLWRLKVILVEFYTQLKIDANAKADGTCQYIN